MWDLIFDSLIDALIDGAIILPFLFVVFLIIEGIEHKSGSIMTKLADASEKEGSLASKLGPVWGSALGLIPQCGFSVMGANMYAGGIITLGTLMAIFLATSDEAIIIMASNPSAASKVLPLLGCKLVIGVVFGFTVDFAHKIKYKKKKEECEHEHGHIEGHCEVHEHHHEPHDLCENCGCDKYPGIVRPALYHTVKLFVFIFVFTFILNIVIGAIGTERLSAFLLGNTVFQPFLTALVGLIPNCAASVLITELFVAGSISFGSAVAGLCAGAGIGLAVLFKMHTCTKKNIGIVALLYAISVFSGLVINLF